MNLVKAKDIAVELIQLHGLKNWRFLFDNSKVRFGVCHSYGKIIGLSKNLTLLNNEKEVINIILHEIAHALDVEIRGYSNHDKHWKELAVYIGCSGETYYNSKVINQPKGNYTLKCNNCTKEYTAFKRPKRNKACRECCDKYSKGHYDEKYRLKIIKNK